MYKKALRLTACGLASALLITGSNTTTYAAPVAGVTSAMEVGASNDTLVAGFSLTFSNYMASSELVAKGGGLPGHRFLPQASGTARDQIPDGSVRLRGMRFPR